MAIPVLAGEIVGVDVHYKNVGYAPIGLRWRVALRQHDFGETWNEGDWTGYITTAINEESSTSPIPGQRGSEMFIPSDWGPGLKDIRVDVDGDIKKAGVVQLDGAFEVVVPELSWIKIITAEPYVI